MKNWFWGLKPVTQSLVFGALASVASCSLAKLILLLFSAEIGG